ncbi:hypothetical protein [Palleronia marisminoris]|nr:hypothetical protein [Palleronia marisminoris]
MARVAAFPQVFDNSPLNDYPVPQVRNIDGGTLITSQGTNAFILAPHPNDTEELKKTLEFFGNATTIAANDIAAAAKDRHPARMYEAAFEITVRIMRRPFKELVSALINQKQTAQNDLRKLFEAHTVIASRAAAIANSLLAMDANQVMTRVPSMSADQLATLLNLRNLIALPDDMWRSVEMKYVVAANFDGERTLGATQFAKKPSLEEPAASGVDKGQLANWVEARMALLEATEARVSEISTMLQRYCAVVAATTDKQPFEIWAALYE